MAIGEHYSLKLFGTYLGQQFLNTFAYRQTAGAAPVAASDLATQFDASLLFDLASSVGDQVAYDRIECFAIETPTDFVDITPVNNAGTRVILLADRLASWAAFGFRSNRNGAGTRSSYKRFCGMGEQDVESNVLSVAFSTRASVLALQTALGQTLIHASGNAFQPVQLQSGWSPGFPPVENFVIGNYAPAYYTSQVSRRP